MKTTIISIIISFLFCNLNAQNENDYSYKLKSNIDSNNTIEFKQHLPISNSFKALIVPQFGSLFRESFKQVKGIQNLENYYDIFDLALNLGFTYQIISRLNLISVYNLGILKFDRVEQGIVKGTLMKLSLCYNF